MREVDTNKLLTASWRERDVVDGDITGKCINSTGFNGHRKCHIGIRRRVQIHRNVSPLVTLVTTATEQCRVEKRKRAVGLFLYS